MAYNEKLAERLSKAFTGNIDVIEKKMFGGLAYMYKDHMCVGIIDDMLIVRVDPKKYEKALSEKHLDLWISPPSL